MNLILLQQAIDYIETIPDNVFNLESIYSKRECGTIACAAGWLAQNPDFQALGLGLAPNTPEEFSGARLKINGVEKWWDYSISELFGLEHDDGVELFGTRGCGALGYAEEMAFPGTDKQLWLQRARTFIAEQQVPA